MSARLIAIAALLLAAPVAAEETPAELADRFERALVAGDARMLPLAEGFSYVENGAELPRWEGMWRTTTAIAGDAGFPQLDYRVELADGDEIIRVVEVIENTVHGVMAYRLRARDGQIASVEMLPIREEFGGDRGGTLTLLQPMLPHTMDGALVGSSAALLGARERTSEAVIRNAMQFYFRAMTGGIPRCCGPWRWPRSGLPVIAFGWITASR